MTEHFPLLVKLTAISLLATALFAAGLGWAVEQHLIGAAVNDAIRAAVDVVQNVITPQVTADDFGPPTPDRIEAWRRRVAEVVGRMEITRVKVWNAAGQVVYADNPTLIGRVYPLKREDDLRRVLIGGSVVTDVSALRKPNAHGERPYGRLMDIYTPILLRGSRQIVGAYQVSRTVILVEARIAHIRSFILETGAGAFSILYGLLFFCFINRAARRLQPGSAVG